MNCSDKIVGDETPVDMHKVREVVLANANRVGALGKWPVYINATESLVARLPVEGKVAPGFDAGLACALDLIPRDKQALAATLHAAYTPEAVEQVRRECNREEFADTETCWWLAACSLCVEGKVDEEMLGNQIKDFERLIADTKLRDEKARREFVVMKQSFETTTYGIPFGTTDGCIQGAYVSGHPFGTYYSKEYGLFFIGTNEKTLGLENFPWSDEKDEQGRAKSGGVFGSVQFVKCATEEEFLKALAVVRKNFFY